MYFADKTIWICGIWKKDDEKKANSGRQCYSKTFTDWQSNQRRQLKRCIFNKKQKTSDSPNTADAGSANEDDTGSAGSGNGDGDGDSESNE